MKAPKHSRHGHLVSALAFVAGALCVSVGGAGLRSARRRADGDAERRHGDVREGGRACGRASGASSATTTSAANYTVRTTTLASGTVINEYLSTEGVVFGIAWHGRRAGYREPARQLFPAVSARPEGAARGARRTRAGERAGSGLVVDSGGHMGSFAGTRICRNRCLPASASDIQ